MKLAWILVLVGAIHVCAGSRILVIVPMPARSHSILFERLVIELAKKGHQVTYISSFKQSEDVPNLEEIVLPNLHTFLIQLFSQDKDKPPNMFEMKETQNPIMSLIFMPEMGIKLMNKLLSDPVMQKFLKEDRKYDLIIGESFLDESMLAGFSQKYNAPIIAVATFMPNIWSNYLVGNPAPAAYIPDPLLGYSNVMTFKERVINTLISTAGEFMHSVLYLPKQDAIMRRFFGEDLPPIQEILLNTSLVFVNHHHSLAFPRPYLPNMIEIGGYHINPTRPLPKDIGKFMNESKNGVILFSMGSNLKSTQMPQKTKDAILTAFSRLKQNVLWKFEDDTMQNLPKNVKVSKWLPQSDILAHPNLKLFITHGGLLSTTEAVFRGVPVVGIPIFGDQPLNMRQTENAGLGVALDFDTITEESFYNAVTEILNNPKYAENAKKRSTLLNDLPMTAMDTALYWIEYVIRHKGAPHLKSAAQDLSWYQLYLLDVYGVLALGAIVTIAINVHITKCVLRRICSKFCSKSKKETSEKKKN